MTEQSDRPNEGDTYHCKQCEMSILVTTSCSCETDGSAFFSCCGEQLEKSPSESTS